MNVIVLLVVLAIALQGIVLLSALLTSAGLRTLRKSLPFVGPKMLPSNILGVKFPYLEVVDQEGRRYQLGRTKNTFSLLFLSRWCPVCTKLGTGLKYHSHELNYSQDFFIVTENSFDEIKSLFRPSKYSVLNDRRLIDFIRPNTIPTLVTIRNNSVAGTFIVNSIDQIFSLVRPELVTEVSG